MQAATGTWNGPAPQGQLDKQQHGKPVPTPETTARPVPRDVRVGSARINMVVFRANNVAAARSAGAVSALTPCDKSQCSEVSDAGANSSKLPPGSLVLHAVRFLHLFPVMQRLRSCGVLCCKHNAALPRTRSACGLRTLTQRHRPADVLRACNQLRGSLHID